MPQIILIAFYFTAGVRLTRLNTDYLLTSIGGIGVESLNGAQSLVTFCQSCSNMQFLT